MYANYLIEFSNKLFIILTNYFQSYSKYGAEILKHEKSNCNTCRFSYFVRCYQ